MHVLANVHVSCVWMHMDVHVSLHLTCVRMHMHGCHRTCHTSSAIFAQGGLFAVCGNSEEAV